MLRSYAAPPEPNLNGVQLGVQVRPGRRELAFTLIAQVRPFAGGGLGVTVPPEWSEGVRREAMAGPSVVVMANQPTLAGALAASLEACGLETRAVATERAAIETVAGRRADAVLIAAGERTASERAELAHALRTAAGRRPLTLVLVAGAGDPAQSESDTLYDLVVHPPLDPRDLVARIGLAQRRQAMQAELALRAATLSAFGVAPPAPAPAEGPLQVLFVGAPARQFLGLHRMLARRGARVTAALTTFTAFDYLHHAAFDAIALNAATGPEPARGVYAALRRNSRFAHTPVVMLEAARRAGLRAPLRESRQAPRAVTQTAPIDERPDVLAQRIVTLAEEARRHASLRTAFGALRFTGVADPETGLANARFFLAHFAAMTERAQATGAPLSLVVARTRPDQPIGAKALGRGRAEFARLLEGFVRTEDLVGRLDAGIYAIAMPGADGAEADGAADRLTALARSAAFEAGPEALGATFQFLLTARVGQVRPEDTAGDLLARTASAFRPAVGG